MNLNQLFENTNSGGNYAEDLAKQVFDANPNIRDENQILDAAWPLAVTAMGNKRAMSMFNYDADFPSDLVSVYGWLQKDQQGMAEDDDSRDKFYYQRNNIWRVMDGDELVHEYTPDRYEVVGAKKLLARFDDEGYDVTHVISPMGVVTYLYGKPMDEEQLSEIGNTPTGRAALGAVQNRAYDKMDAWSANPTSGYSSTPKDVNKATSAAVAAGNRLHGFGPDNSRENTVMARDALRQKQALRQTQGMAEDKPRFDPLVAKIAAKMKGPTENDAIAALITVLGTSAYNERKHFYKLWIDQAIDKYSEEGLAEGMDDSPVAGAITRRIMLQRVDLLSKYGPEKVLNAIDEVADFVGDTEEIGSSDVSGWVRQVEQTLGQMEQGLGEAGRNYHANTTGFARGARDDERHDLDRDSQTWYIRLNGKLIRDKQGMPYSFRGKAAANKAAVTMQAKLFNQGKEFVLTTNPNDPQQGVAERVEEAANAKQQAAIAIAKKKELAEFAPPGGNEGDSGRWYTDDELADIIGDDWFEDFDVSHDEFNIDAYGEKAKQNLASYANSWFDDKGYNVNVMGVEHNDVDHDLKWYIEGSFHNPRFAEQGVAEAGFPGAPDVEMPPMKPSGDPQRDKLKQEYMDLHREIKSLVDIPYSSNASPEQKMQAKARIKQLNDRADQIKAILEPRQPPNEWQKKTYGYDDNWNIVKKGMAEGASSIEQKIIKLYKQGLSDDEIASRLKIDSDDVKSVLDDYEWVADTTGEEKGVAEEKVRLDPKCWTGKKIGNPKTKVKGGVRVNNCVPAESVAESKSKPANLLLWEQAQSVASSKFDPGLTEAANSWAKIWYKNKGGVWQ